MKFILFILFMITSPVVEKVSLDICLLKKKRLFKSDLSEPDRRSAAVALANFIQMWYTIGFVFVAIEILT